MAVRRDFIQPQTNPPSTAAVARVNSKDQAQSTRRRAADIKLFAGARSRRPELRRRIHASRGASCPRTRDTLPIPGALPAVLDFED